VTVYEGMKTEKQSTAAESLAKEKRKLQIAPSQLPFKPERYHL